MKGIVMHINYTDFTLKVCSTQKQLLNGTALILFRYCNLSLKNVFINYQ